MVQDKWPQRRLGPGAITEAPYSFTGAATLKHHKLSDFSNRSLLPQDLEAGLVASEGLSSLTQRWPISPSGCASVLVSSSKGTVISDYRPP